MFESRKGKVPVFFKFETGSGTHPLGGGGSISGGKGDNSYPSSAEVTYTLIYTATPPIRHCGVVLN